MIRIKFTDKKMQHRAVGYLAGRFSAKLFRGGEVLVPEVALEALAAQDFTFTVLGKATYDQMAAIRSDVGNPVQ